jgi:6-phosphogluconolactonase
VSAVEQAPDHVSTHAPQTDHSDLHEAHVSLISKMTIETIVGAIPELAERFAQHLEGAYGEARAEGRPLTIAIPGGSVAQAFFPRLVKLPLDWRHVLVFFVDERAGASESPDSNARLARALWLDRVPIPVGNVHRMHGEAKDLDGAAARYERDLIDVLGEPPRLDVVLLGMGEDGHVASLFPGKPALDETKRYVVPVPDAPKPPPGRLSLTLLAIAQSRALVLAAFGATKASAVRQALDVTASPLPAARALRSGPRPMVLLDPEAASR